jgi:hypothetical protein
MNRQEKAPRPVFRRSFKPRPARWLQAWISMYGFLVVAVTIVHHLVPGFSRPLGEDALLGAVIATFNVFSAVYTEWKSQPRRLYYWRDDTPSGVAIRHLYSGELLYHTNRSVLRPAELRDVNLTEADLRLESLIGLDFRGARLRGANLEEARLYQCCFDGADLVGCRLAGAWLHGASFKGADLRGADFRGRGGNRTLTTRRMEGANFFGARYNAATRWPPGFAPAEHGCAYENDAEQPLPIPAVAAPAEVETFPIAAQSAADAPAEPIVTVGWHG